jgi:formylglycine-generating enzyme required for sulfatase activity
MARVGGIRGVRFSNITIRDGRGGWHGNPQPITLVGHPDSWIEDVTFENMKVTLPGGTPSAADGRGYVPAYTKRYSPDRLGLRAASVLYAREVRGLLLRDVAFTLEKPDPRPPVVGQDWERVTFDRVRFTGATAENPLVLENARAVTITDSAPLPNLRDASAPTRETPFVWQPADAKAKPPVAEESFDVVTSEPRFAIRMLRVQPGSFRMGSPDSEPRREPDETQREVKLAEGFWLSAHEITQRQWFAIMGTNPSRFETDPELPVHNVSWKDAMEFCRRLTLRERAAGRLAAGQSFTLPTEAQWEFACRAGTTTPYSAEPLDAHAWYDLNLVQRPIGAAPMQTGLKKPNAWGFHDMHGNVWEWCLDDYDDGSTPARKVIRGGSWRTGPFSLRSANRASLQPEAATHDTGFRIALKH